MSSCSQSFGMILRNLFRASDNPFTSFKEGEPLEIESSIKNVVDKVVQEWEKSKLKPSSDAVQSYDFKMFEKQLSAKKALYKGLSDEIISNISFRLKEAFTSSEQTYLTNPVDENGNSIFDFDDMSKLTFGVESMENFVASELQQGVFKCSFLSVGSSDYEKFVVTNTALNKNIIVYKNELWDYINNAAVKLGIDSRVMPLYKNGVLNQEVFTSGLYSNILSRLSQEMNSRMKSSDSSESLRVFSDNNFSVAQAYLKGLVLANFDNLLLTKHADKISVNQNSINSFNLPINGDSKYSLEFKWSKSIKIDNSETASDIDHHSSSLVKMLSEIIPYYELSSVGSREIWVKNKNGLTIGKSNLDSVGAILNGLSNNFTFNIKIGKPNENGIYNEKSYTIGKAFKDYDNGILTFQQILNGLITSSGNDNDLSSRRSVLESLNKFLYGENGIHNNFVSWSIMNPDYADFVLNPEIALINHIRNTVKNVYREEPIDAIGRTVDVLNLNTTIGSDYLELVGNITKAWKTKKVGLSDLNNITDYDSFFDFLTDPEKGGMTISDRSKNSFKKNNKIDFTSDNFKNAFKRLLTRSANGISQSIDETGIKYENVSDNDLSSSWRSESVNDQLHLTELFKQRHTAEKYNILTQVRKFDDSSMPTMGIANLASLYNISLASADKDNFFIKNPNLFNGMEILLEVYNDKTSLPTPDLNHNEAFKLAFTRHFLRSGISEGKYLIQPWDFSDKPKIFALGINSNSVLYGFDKQFSEMPVEDLRTAMFNTQRDYYTSLMSNIYDDYSKLDPEYFSKHKPTSTLSKLKVVSDYIDSLGSKSALMDKVADVFNRGGYTEITEDLHYADYKGTLKFNQMLDANIRIFTNKETFNIWADRQENKLLNFLTTQGINVSWKEFSINGRDKTLKRIGETFNLDQASIVDNDKLNLLNSVNGKLAPLFAKYLWSKNLVISQYANLTTKDVFMHPAKVKFKEHTLFSEDWWKAYEVEDNNRSTAFTKRMNIPGASMTIYGRGTHGIPPKIKLAIMKDPTAKTFDWTGNVQGQDVSDGGGHTNPFLNELLEWSLPGLDLKRTQKPIGESINSKFATTLKFAIFAITNEEVRKSMFSKRSAYAAMQNMNKIDLFEGRDPYNIMGVVNGDITDIIDVSKITNDNLWIPINGKYRKFTNLTWDGGRNYNLYYDVDGEQQSKKVTINNLFDLWEAFGGAFSSSMDNGKISNNELSIKIVGSILKKHSMAGNIELKDKMIGLLLPQSAVKKGATNVNPTDNIYNTNKNISWFNFDTSFFGVQLKSYHSVDEAETNEITQVVSAISEFASTPELYNQVYNAIGELIDDGLSKFQTGISTVNGKQRLIESFIKNMNKSAQINNGRIIVNGVVNDTNKEIPINNKALYKQFVSYIVSNINADFVRRKFRGVASVLNPSHGIITIYEDHNGVKKFTSDLMNDFDNLNLDTELKGSEFEIAQQKVQYILSNTPEYQDKEILLSEVEPLDFIKTDIPVEINGKVVNPGTVIELNKFSDFFDFKRNAGNAKIYRVFNIPRDLKPVRITYSIDGVPTNLYDTVATEVSYMMDIDPKNPKVVAFKKYINKINPEIKSLSESRQNELYTEYAKRLVMRTTDLLAHNKIFAKYNEESESPFDEMLSYTDADGNTKLDNFTSRYDSANSYNNEREVTDYIHRNAENVHSNVHQSVFGIENIPLAQVDENLFFNKIKEYGTLNPDGNTPYDIYIANSSDQIYIITNHDKYSVSGDKLLDKSGNVVGKQTKLIVDKRPDGSSNRITNFGKKMYTLPEKYTAFKDNMGHDIIFVEDAGKGVDVCASQFIKKLNGYNIVKFNEWNYKENLVDRSLVSLMKMVRGSVESQYLRDYISNKIASIEAFRKTIPADQFLSDDTMSKYGEYLKNTNKEVFMPYLRTLSKAMYNSWLYSTKALTARIPAQAMQSFMSMDTVGYISGEANDIYVSHWQLKLQGSDYDIDKLYMMMYDFKDGIFSGWSPYFNIMNKNSFNLPLPNKRSYTYVSLDGKDSKGNDIITNDDNTINIDDLTKGISSKLDKLIFALNYLKDRPEIQFIKGENNFIANRINNHNKFSSEDGFKNFIVNKLIATSQHPSNQVASYSPISFGVYDDLKKQLSAEYSLSLYDGHTMLMQQEQNAVGKKVIGIAATGLKNYFALIKYYNDYYSKVENISPLDSAYFLRQFTLVDKESKQEDGNYLPKTYTINKIAGINLSEKANEILRQSLKDSLSSSSYTTNDGNKLSNEEINKIVNGLVSLDRDAALDISSILSLATDNAKELMLAKINAGIDFAGMHIYLAILGIDTEVVAKYMTSPKAMDIKKAMSRDFFVDSKFPSVPVRLNSLLSGDYKKLKEELNNLYVSKSISEDPSSYDKKIDDINKKIDSLSNKVGIDQRFLDEFIRIYNHAGELTSMGSLLKVNQGSKSSQEDLYKLSNQIQTVILNQEQQFFSKELGKPEEVLENQWKQIIEDKPYLANNKTDVMNILSKALSYGISNKGSLNTVRYFTDEDYRDTASQYYNLIKYTFNTLDLLNNLPHFSSMYKAFIIGSDFLSNNIQKYGFLGEPLEKIIEFGTKNGEISSQEIMKATHLMGSSSNPVSLNPTAINGANDYIDSVILSQYFVNHDFSIDLKALCKHLGISNISLLSDDKMDVKEQSFNVDNLPIDTVSLSDEYGRAQFKYLMEHYIIPNLKSTYKDNGFLKNLVFTSHKNYNLKNKISYYMDPSNFAELETLEVGINRLIDRSNIGGYSLPIKSIDGNLSNFRVMDLLSLYDMLTNEGRFGGNRTTALLSKDIDLPDSVSKSYAEFQLAISKSPDFLNNLFDTLLRSRDARLNLYLRMFGSTNRGVQTVSLSRDKSAGSTITVNRYYSLPDSLDNAIINTKSISLANDIIKLTENTFQLWDKSCE